MRKRRYGLFFSLLILFLIGNYVKLSSQSFDTLLVDYSTIGEIFPLDDGSFILIGAGEKSIVERIDSTGQPIWSVSFGLNYNDDDYLDDGVVHMLPEDSTIQIAIARKYCDYYDTSDIKVFTLNFKGLVLDSLLVRAKDLPRYITLLSGNPKYPRIAYVRNNNVVLQYANADTAQLQVAIPGVDSIINQLVGLPICMALSPIGTLLVGTGAGSLMSFKDDGTGFHFFKNKFFAIHTILSNQVRQLISVDEYHYIALYWGKIELYSFTTGMEKSFSNPWGFQYLVWSPPYFYIMDDDSLYVFNTFLERIYQEPVPEYEQYIGGFAIRNQTTFTVGSGSAYFEGGFLGSEDQITHDGPKYYDIELVDFQVGPYDSVFWDRRFGFHYQYNIRDAFVTIKNNCDYPIQNTTVYYQAGTSYCSDTGWYQEIKDMNLLPGEIKSFELHDIFIWKDYPISQWYGACIYAIRPDNHADDNFDNNELCKKVELIPSSVVVSDFPIQHYPPAIADEIHFYAPEEFEFDLTIFNFSGIQVFQSHANTSTGYSADLSFLPPGIYIFQYYLPSEGKMYVEKILKY